MHETTIYMVNSWNVLWVYPWMFGKRKGLFNEYVRKLVISLVKNFCRVLEITYYSTSLYQKLVRHLPENLSRFVSLSSEDFPCFSLMYICGTVQVLVRCRRAHQRPPFHSVWNPCSFAFQSKNICTCKSRMLSRVNRFPWLKLTCR